MGRIFADFFEGVCLKRNTDPDSYRDGFNGLGRIFFGNLLGGRLGWVGLI
jgi:hypothetical protein